MTTQIHSHIAARKIDAFRSKLKKFDCNNARHLPSIGLGFDSASVSRLYRAAQDRKMAFALDAIQGGVTSGSIATPVQFLQNWLPGLVLVLTAARKIDELVGITTAGAWEDEEVVMQILEMLGTGAVPYGDVTNTPLSSWNANQVHRSVVRFEEGLQVGRLEEARAARLRIDSASEKRNAAGIALEINRNYIGFNGYNSGLGLTYGFLNDPGLPAYVTAANGVSGLPTWVSKTFLEIVADIVGMASRLRIATKDIVDPSTTPITLALATSVIEYLTTTAVYGNVSVRQWIAETYPKMRIVSAPELSAANGGANVAYMYPDRIEDGSTDGGKVFDQIVPMKFKLNGVEQKAKVFIESYSNATMGVVCKRPYAVQRLTGI